ncbi:MAG TPA: PrsW family glutamic-type intramembrane protease [Mycobacteriales bacterium]|nr:PrsW family glutamic-type intramembrane protease [Mycobacteriales bacterium]
MTAASHRARSVLLVAMLLSAFVGCVLLIDLLGPDADKSGPLHKLYSPALPWYVRDTALAVVVSWPVALVVGGAGWFWSRATPMEELRRRRQAVAAVAAAVILVAPYPVFEIGDVDTNGHTAALLAIPSTAFALWVVYRMQRYHRLPVPLFLLAFLWGLVALGFAGVMNITAIQIASNHLLHSASDLSGADYVKHQVTVAHKVDLAGFASAGVCEELGKGAFLAVVYLTARHHLSSVVSGIVLGAAVGLGFNLGETVEYMGVLHGFSAAYQYWARQGVGLFAAHAAFTALTGAGFAIAAALPSRKRRVIAIGAGYLAAAGGHFATDTVLSWFSEKALNWSIGPAVEAWLLTPGEVLGTSGLFLVLYLLLLWLGLKDQRRLLESAMRIEIATGSGAIAPGDVPVLLAPRLRLQRRILALRMDGWAGMRTLIRLQRAQLDLAAGRGRMLRGRHDRTGPDEPTLRARVLALRYGPAGVSA